VAVLVVVVSMAMVVPVMRSVAAMVGYLFVLVLRSMMATMVVMMVVMVMMVVVVLMLIAGAAASMVVALRVPVAVVQVGAASGMLAFTIECLSPLASQRARLPNVGLLRAELNHMGRRVVIVGAPEQRAIVQRDPLDGALGPGALLLQTGSNVTQLLLRLATAIRARGAHLWALQPVHHQRHLFVVLGLIDSLLLLAS
jgi:hypothetical protein